MIGLGIGVLVAAGAVASILLVVALNTRPTQYDDSFWHNSPPAPRTQAPTDEDDEENEKNRRRKPANKPGHTYHVVVLGDIGRSPRMQYHAISIAKHGGSVYLFGNTESQIHPDIVSNPLIEIVSLAPPPSFLLKARSKLLFPLVAPLKALWQAFSLYHALCYRSAPARWMLVQNPPSIPTLAIASIVCFLRNTKLVIDWHNFGYSILALKLGPHHLLVRISALYEKVFSWFAHSHFTVTHAMSRVLSKDYGVSALTLHDRPASLYRPMTDQASRMRFLHRLPDTAPYAEHFEEGAENPWKLLVSSTSWTPDEDFSILLDALVSYSEQTLTDPTLPPILLIITGKGPLKQEYLYKISTLNAQKKLTNVKILTAWLTPEDYASLLAAADLGVSLHMSSSGVDLPMKVVDMFGAGLPVVGWSKFEAWPELVREGVNGRGFGSASGLCALLVDLFGPEGKKRDGMKEYTVLKEGALRESEHRWDDEWDRVAGGLFGIV